MGQTSNRVPFLTILNDNNTDKNAPSNITKAIVQFVNKQVTSVYLDSRLTCLQLKTLLYQKVNPALQPQNMALRLNGKLIENGQIVGELLLLNDLIVQQRISLSRIADLEYHRDEEDLITCQKGVVLMSCGHSIGRSAMSDFIKNSINEKQYDIRCPFEGCNAEWDYNLCKKVGCFTRNQNRHFLNSLNQNWIERNTKICPGCKSAVFYDGSGCEKVYCTNKKCKMIFCYLCLNKWQSPKQQNCGNVHCNFNKTFWNDVGTKQFELYHQNGQDVLKVDVPTHRLCPSCKTSIEHTQGCKHMRCQNCNTNFCFICLQIYNGGWSCGSYNQYCGKIAEKQKLL